MQERLDQIAAEHEALTMRMADPAVLADPAEIMRISQRLAELKPIVECWHKLERVEKDIAGAKELLASGDDDMRHMAEQELKELRVYREQLDAELTELLRPKDPDDLKNVVLEIRAGTGGEEAGLFAADLYRMYLRYAERQGWRVEEVSRSESGIGGLKEVIAMIEGRGAYSRLKFESGVHRVQRVPATEAQGRIHTSAVTVAVLPEAEDVEIDLNPADLRIDTFRSQGAGGQHVNKTDSAVRITHIPSGIVVSCQDEKSQHKNRAKAMRVLKARLLEAEQEAIRSERAAKRKAMVGSGDRSERIRTYNFPQNRVTDHRIELTLYKLEEFMEGALDEMIDALAKEATAAALAEAGKS